MTPYLAPGIMSIDEVVAQSFKIEKDLLYAKSRKRIGVEARQFAMWWRCRNTTDILSRIGERYGGRDHATVLHARKTVENLLETDKEFREKAETALAILEHLKT